MERLKEEHITKFLIQYLKNKKFDIYAYDFPQSGTGYCLKPNLEKTHKNINFWIPDIIATKNNKLFLFENKDHYSKSDIKKIENIIVNKTHSNAIKLLNISTHTKQTYIFLSYPIKYFKQKMSMKPYIDAEIGCDLENNRIIIKSHKLPSTEDIDNWIKNIDSNY